MPVITENAKVELAKFVVNQQQSMYLVLGKTSAWSNEQVPPEPIPNTTQLEEVVGYKRVSKAVLVRPTRETDTNKEKITFNNNSWTIINQEDAIQEGAKWAYFESKIVGNELPLGTYRQVGISINVKPRSQKSALLPSEVEDTGTLLFYDNKQFQNRTNDVSNLERLIVEF